MPMKPAVMTATRQPISSRLTSATASKPVSRLPESDESCRSTPVAKSAVIDRRVAVGEGVRSELAVDEVAELEDVLVGRIGADQSDRDGLLVAARLEGDTGESGDPRLVARLGDQVADLGGLDLHRVLQCRGEGAGLALEVGRCGVGRADDGDQHVELVDELGGVDGAVVDGQVRGDVGAEVDAGVDEALRPLFGAQRVLELDEDDE